MVMRQGSKERADVAQQIGTRQLTTTQFVSERSLAANEEKGSKSSQAAEVKVSEKKQQRNEQNHKARKINAGAQDRERAEHDRDRVRDCKPLDNLARSSTSAHHGTSDLNPSRDCR